MALNLNDAINYAECVQAAAAISTLNVVPPPYQIPPGYSLVTPLYANDLVTDISVVTSYVPFGFVAQNGPNYVVAIRGTDNILEWVDDAQFKMKACAVTGGVGQTEDGFTDVYASLGTSPNNGNTLIGSFLKARLQPGDSVVVCGHSLGAALATLCGYDIALNVQPSSLAVYTYASPNVGDGTFANSYNAEVPVTWRIVNPFDVVTHVPTEFMLGYRSVGDTVEFNPMGQVKMGILCYHHLQTYLHLMSASAGIVPPINLDPECVP